MPDANHDLVSAVDQLRRSIDTLRAELVRKDVFQEVVRNLNDRINDVKGDVDQLSRRFDTYDSNRTKDRWVILTGLIFPALVGIVLLYVAAQIGGSPT